MSPPDTPPPTPAPSLAPSLAPSPAPSFARSFAGGCLVLLTLALVAWPVGAVLVAGVRRALSQGWGNTPSLVPTPALVLSTLAWAVGIALFATFLAWPMAWALRRHGAAMAAVVLTPLLLPSYLVYHALGLNRAPQTLLGDLIEQAATHGAPWLPVFVGRALAVIGLSIWCAPIAALILGSALRGVDQASLDALQADGASWLRRQLVVLRMLRRSVLMCLALLMLLMLGSAVPLHLAQAPTLAITTWLAIMISPEDARSWLVGWPLMVIAVAAGWWFSRGPALAALGLVQGAWTPREHASPRGVRLGTVFTILLVLLATLVPVVLYVLTLHDWTLVPTFLRLAREAMLRSLWIALVVGGLSVGVAFLGMRAWTLGARAGVRLALALLLVAMLSPGIMLGQAYLAAFSPLGTGVFDSPLPTIACHVARFSALALAIGLLLAASESQEARDARRLDAGGSLVGWWTLCVRPHAWTLVGLGVAIACFSFHEIEASIILQPIGSVSFAQTMLGQLHFARQDELAAGAIVVVGIGTLAGWVGAWLLIGRSRGG